MPKRCLVCIINPPLPRAGGERRGWQVKRFTYSTSSTVVLPGVSGGVVRRFPLLRTRIRCGPSGVWQGSWLAGQLLAMSSASFLRRTTDMVGMTQELSSLW
jgi:hypothetical protein